MAEQERPQILRPADDVSLWVDDGGSIHLKAVTPHGDPIELNAHEAQAVAQALLALAAELDAAT